MSMQSGVFFINVRSHCAVVGNHIILFATYFGHITASLTPGMIHDDTTMKFINLERSRVKRKWE